MLQASCCVPVPTSTVGSRWNIKVPSLILVWPPSPEVSRHRCIYAEQASCMLLLSHCFSIPSDPFVNFVLQAFQPCRQQRHSRSSWMWMVMSGQVQQARLFAQSRACTFEAIKEAEGMLMRRVTKRLAHASLLSRLLRRQQIRAKSSVLSWNACCKPRALI